MIDAREGSFSIGGIDAGELASRFGTPVFVYDAEAVRATYRQVRGAFSHAPSRVHYAAVCNPNLHLLRLLRAEGAGLHANTPGDVYCGLRAGFTAEEIVFSGSNLGDEDLAYLFEAGVHVNVDSLDDLARACRFGRGRLFGLRVHLEGILPESRMGLREQEIAAAVALARRSGCTVGALHVYCGTHGQSPGRYGAALERLVTLAELVPDLDCINLGGGFGYDYRAPEAGGFPFAALGAEADAALAALSRALGRPVTLRIEPGRSLVAGAGVLLTRVRSVKQGRAKRYVGVDTTTANFTSPAVHGAHRRVCSVAARKPHSLPADVCGATTYSRDVIAHDTALPEVAADDLLAVLDTGAYGYCMSGHFLNRPRPPEVFVDAGEARLVTRRETFADLVAAQSDLPVAGGTPPLRLLRGGLGGRS
jgi:diaminopimelate decarboxylase